MKTGKTRDEVAFWQPQAKPHWSPVMKTGKTCVDEGLEALELVASMEPGHEDRED